MTTADAPAAGTGKNKYRLDGDRAGWPAMILRRAFSSGAVIVVGDGRIIRMAALAVTGC
jgi:hypothetical protein